MIFFACVLFKMIFLKILCFSVLFRQATHSGRKLRQLDVVLTAADVGHSFERERRAKNIFG